MQAELFTVLCVLAVGALLLAEARRHRRARVVAKTVASLAFIGVALALGATATVHGQLILAALVLSLLGDVLLLSERRGAFLGGLVAFLGAHVGYGAAFAVLGLSAPATGVAAVLALLAGAAVLRWLWPALGPAWRPPVLAYLVVILAMCVLAAGHAGASGRWHVAVGALVFAASDLAVAREKFVRPALANKLWGLPAYYLAQLLLAWFGAGPR